jgi:hypothetical protein
MDTMENVPAIDQENPKNSENIQENKDLPLENTNQDTENDAADTSVSPKQSEGSDNEGGDNQDSDELPLPGDESADKKKEIPKWAEKRITKKEREAALLRAENEKLRAAIQTGAIPGAPQIPQAEQVEAPRRENYNTEHEYISAIVKHENHVAAQKFHAERQQANLMAAEVEFQKNLKTTIDKGADKYDDFEEKTAFLFTKEFPPNRAMAEAIVHSDFKDDILYFLGTYQDEALKIAQMNGVAAVRAITKLEARFESRGKTKSSGAPRPISPVGTNGGKTNAVNNMQDLARIAATDDQRAFEDAVKKLASQRRAF